MDLRGLNKITETVRFPLPTPREMFDQLANSWWYSSMDCRWAYWSVPLREQDQAKTSFTIRNRKYCWKVITIQWTDDCEWSFQTLKDSLTSAPTLAFPDWSKMLVIETDASSTGLGAVLLQETDLGRQPIAYASRSCSPQEKNYSATEIECLGVIFALKTFRCYVIGSRFRLVTDHQALKNLKLVKKPSGRVARWLMTLLEYDFELVYRSGKLSTTADCLSRLPRADTALMKKENQYQRPRRKEEILSGTIFSDPSVETEHIARAQREDPLCGPIIKYLNKEVSDGKTSQETVALSRYMSSCWGILWHHHDYQGENRRTGTRLQMVVPEVMRTQILQWAHEGAFGTHVGREKAFEALLEGYWWPNMARDLGHFIRTCSTCQQFK
ncbi:unnamed protein product, partial [Heterosigma akashiwo]